MVPVRYCTALIYTPTANFNGADSFTFKANDGHVDSVIATVTITVTEAPPTDTQTPIIFNIIATPNPVPVNTPVTLTATIDDQATGNSNIASAEYRIDGLVPRAMTASDGSFDSNREAVTTTLQAYSSAGVHNISIKATDAAGNINDTAEEIFLVVYDPNGGFVTGGGWINSPAGVTLLHPQ